MLEELVKKLPGAEVDEDGNIKINGKEVKKIMVDGKEFFGGDVKTGLKNLPVDMVDKLKTYDKKSDLARITGIDDGEEETVLDLTVKKGMNQGWFGNVDLAGGTEDRYMGRAMINRFYDKTQFSIIGSANNVNDQGFSGGGGGPRWRRNNGLKCHKNAGRKLCVRKRPNWNWGVVCAITIVMQISSAAVILNVSCRAAILIQTRIQTIVTKLSDFNADSVWNGNPIQ